jgi:hypothetical protein
MRNNNPGNIKYVGQAGTTPSANTDQGDPQAVYASPEAGMAAMYDLLRRKYAGGKLTPAQIIAGNMGWTPGNTQAAQNVADSMGIGVNDDIGMSDPVRAAKFMRALMKQEHGEASNQYTDAQINTAISSAPATTTSPRISGPVEAAGGGGGSDKGAPQLYTDTVAPIVAAATQPTLFPALTKDDPDPWSGLGSTLASSVRPNKPQFLSGGVDAETGIPPTPDFASALPTTAPLPASPVDLAAAAPMDGGISPLGGMFKVAEIGKAATPKLDEFGRPIRQRQYG